ncbi:MAG TPA: putative peptide maturation dehydrogenase [Dokdonella sp.]
MRLRRCALLMLEPRERLDFDFTLIAAGGSGLLPRIETIAIAPQLEAGLALTERETAVVCLLSPSRWCALDELSLRHPPEVLQALVDKQLLVLEGSELDARDRVLRDTHWRAPAAAMHYSSRWRGVDTEAVEQKFAGEFDDNPVERLGVAPSTVREHAGPRWPLPLAQKSPFGDLLDRRVTCRNFDAARTLSLASFSAVLYRVFGARAADDYAPGLRLLKKGVPSAGGLHATGAYVLVQRVEDIAAGLYHYHPLDHALESIKPLHADEAAALAKRFVAAQAYFVDAHVMVMPTSRFVRNFWKYRNHAKAYRALILDVGHLSQTLYLAATELGLGAFITAAINEVDIEEAFGLDPLEEGPLAVCGFGIRAPERTEVEFDPLGAVWPVA